MNTDALLDQVKYDANGLMTAVVQDKDTNEVLMVAFMNKEALQKTLETKKAHYYSRSRQKLWLKGESSGHIQKVSEIRFDCDLDAVVLKVTQEGAACHKGYRTCFYRKYQDGTLVVQGEKLFDPDQVYKKK